MVILTLIELIMESVLVKLIPVEMLYSYSYELVVSSFHMLDIEAAIVTQQQGQEMLDWSTSTMIEEAWA
jgi:hypothetical protein